MTTEDPWLNALSNAPDRRMRLTNFATMIGWERSRLSHHLQRTTARDLVDRTRSIADGRATDAVLTETGWETLSAAAPKHVAWVRTLFFSGITARKRSRRNPPCNNASCLDRRRPHWRY